MAGFVLPADCPIQCSLVRGVGELDRLDKWLAAAKYGLLLMRLTIPGTFYILSVESPFVRRKKAKPSTFFAQVNVVAIRCSAEIAVVSRFWRISRYTLAEMQAGLAMESC